MSVDWSEAAVAVAVRQILFLTHLGSGVCIAAVEMMLIFLEGSEQGLRSLQVAASTPSAAQPNSFRYPAVRRYAAVLLSVTAEVVTDVHAISQHCDRPPFMTDCKRDRVPVLRRDRALQR